MNFSVKKFYIQLAKNELTITDLITLSGVSQKTLSSAKCGTQNPSPKTVGKLARALKCKVEDLLED